MYGLSAIDLGPIYSYGPGPLALLVPGWLGRGRDRKGSPSQYRPLFSGALSRFKLWAIDFKQGDASQAEVVRDMARAIKGASSGQVLTILASSYGATMVIRALAQADVDPDIVNAVLVDPPAGADSLVQLNQFHAGRLGKKIGQMPTWLNEGWAQAAFNKMFCPGLADTDPIEIPEAVQAKGQAETDRYVAEVRKDAFDGQQGFPFTLCAAQIGEMARSADDPAYISACEAVNHRFGPGVKRIISTRANQVVDPTVSDPFYKRYMPRVRRMEAATNHCDYLQRPDFWNNLLSPLL